MTGGTVASSPIDEIKQLIECPIDWSQICSDPEMDRLLRTDWFREIRARQVDCEAHLIDNSNFYPCDFSLALLDSQEASSTLINIHTWHADAKSRYLSRTMRFSRLRAATREQYNKHYVTTGTASDHAVIEESLQTGDAKLLPEITPSVQMDIAWSALADFAFNLRNPDIDEWDACPPGTPLELFERPHLALHVYTERKMGASGGGLTQFACFDFDFSTSLLHVYPVTEKEFNEAPAKAHIG